jgi:hypothetical protein
MVHISLQKFLHLTCSRTTSACTTVCVGEAGRKLRRDWHCPQQRPSSTPHYYARSCGFRVYILDKSDVTCVLAVNRLSRPGHRQPRQSAHVRVRCHNNPCGICGAQSGIGASLSQSNSLPHTVPTAPMLYFVPLTMKGWCNWPTSDLITKRLGLASSSQQEND